MRRRLAHPHHHSHRAGLRAVGALFAIVGAVFTAVGLFSFFGAMGRGGKPHLFWCAFVGLPLLGFGLVLLKGGYLGAIARYAATETAPVAADAMSHIAHGTTDAVQATAAAIATGMRGDAPPQRCASCGAASSAAANFCQQCGKPLVDETKALACPKCHHGNARAARFCAGCGHRLAAT